MDREATGGSAGKWFLCLIGVSLMGMGLLFGWLMVRSYQHAAATREWRQVPAVVLHSVVEERQIKGSPEEYRLGMLYGYEYEGGSHTSANLSPRGAKWSKDRESVVALAEEYAPGSTHTAWVGPSDPGVAILRHDTKAAGYTLWFPGLLVVAGGGMVWGAFRNRKSEI